MSMRRTWTIYSFCEGYPVLVERCATESGALRVAELRAREDGAEYAVVEQVLPITALLSWVGACVHASSHEEA